MQPKGKLLILTVFQLQFCQQLQFGSLYDLSGPSLRSPMLALPYWSIGLLSEAMQLSCPLWMSLSLPCVSNEDGSAQELVPNCGCKVQQVVCDLQNIINGCTCEGRFNKWSCLVCTSSCTVTVALCTVVHPYSGVSFVCWSSVEVAKGCLQRNWLGESIPIFYAYYWCIIHGY